MDEGTDSEPTPLPAATTSALLQVLRGQPAEFVPVAPLYSHITSGPAAAFARETRARMWAERLRTAQTDSLPVHFDEYLAIELAVHETVIRTCYPPPCWHPAVLLDSRDEVERSRVRLRAGKVWWGDAEQRETPIFEPPSPAAPEPDRSASISVWNRVEQFRRELEENPVPAMSPGQFAESLLDSGRFALVQALRRRYGEALPLVASCASPLWTCYQALGFEGMMVSLLEAPDLVNCACERATPHLEPHSEAMRATGVEIAFLEECLTGADVISPALYREFAWPYARRILEFLEQEGFRTVYYVCGNVMPVLDLIAELPFTAFAMEEDKKGYGLDLGEIRRRLGEERILFGNVDAVLIERATDAELLAEVSRQIQLAGERGRFVVSNGSPFTPSTSLERIRFFVESTRRLGAE
jgi:hypothetical protein